jgi:WS/DGAT/MGAT family acyltransferase
MLRGGRALLRAPRRAVSQIKTGLSSLGATALAGINAPAPPTPFNVNIGPHRRYTFLDVELSTLKGIKDSLGGTLNDAVLTTVALALGRYLRDRQYDTDGLVLKAMVPVSVRSTDQRGALGNQVAAMWAPLPVGVENPAECLRRVADAMADLKQSGQAVGAQVLTDLAGFAPPTILSQAARLQPRQPFFNLVVTNVPGPQFPLYLLGRRLDHLYPVVPLAQRQALGIAVMSYDGSLGFGLLGDYDALPDLEGIARDLRWAVDALSKAAGIKPAGRTPRKASSKGAPRKKATPRRAARKPAGAG